MQTMWHILRTSGTSNSAGVRYSREQEPVQAANRPLSGVGPIPAMAANFLELAVPDGFRSVGTTGTNGRTRSQKEKDPDDDFNSGANQEVQEGSTVHRGRGRLRRR
jgi:hypothetical protein